MDVFLWVLQVLLAIIFLMSGGMKLMQPKEKLAERMAFVNDFSDTTIKIIGGLEVLAAIGLVLPPLFDVATWLAPLAAVGLVFTMIGAIFVHIRRNEMPLIGGNVVLLIVALIVAWGRFGPEPF